MRHDVMEHADQNADIGPRQEKDSSYAAPKRWGDSMKNFEIRWKEVASDDKLSDFNSHLKEMEDVDSPQRH